MALRDLRRRINPVPVKGLFEVLAGPVAQPHTPGVRYGRYRTVAFDGCTSIKIADSQENRSWLGRLGVTGYPAVELMTLVEARVEAHGGGLVDGDQQHETFGSEPAQLARWISRILKTPRRNLTSPTLPTRWRSRFTRDFAARLTFENP